MPKRIILLWAVGLLFSIPVLAEGECRGFRDCYDSGVPRTPQGGVLREMRVWPLGIGLQDRVPNYVELLG